MVAAENRLFNRGALLTTVVVVLAMFAGATLFATEPQENTQALGSLPSTPTAAADSIQFAQTSLLDGDVDNSGNQDGIVDPLALLAPAVVAAPGAVIGFVARVNIGLLLALCESPNLSSADWVLVLQRPG